MTKHASDDPEPVIPLPDQSNVIPLHTDAEINPEDTKTADSNPDKPCEAAKGDAEPEPLRDLEKAADAVSDEGSESEDAPSPEEEDYGTDALDDVAAASQKEDFRRKTEPWPNAIDGEQLFADVVRFILRFVVLDAGSAEIVADWILMTYVVHSANLPYAPRLIISAASGNCGKSTLLDVITYLARYALPMAHVTAANYRMEAHRRRCILLDEAQHVLRGRQNEVSELIKLGHSRTQSVVQRIRNVRGRQIIERYNVFGPCVVAGTGNFAPTQIRTRALGVIKLKRKLPHEEVEPFTPTNPMLDHAQAARELRMKMNRWALDNHEPIRTYQPTLSRDLFNNRNKDNASTLLKVAETIGPVAGEKCRQAIEAMVSGDVLDPGELLLGHISALVSDPEITVGNPPRRFGSDGMLWSSDLCALLQDYFPDHYEGLKPAGLRYLLDNFDLHPEPRAQRRGNQILRGYRFSHFRPWFLRYGLIEPDEGEPVAAPKVAEAEVVEPDSDAEGRSNVAAESTDAMRPNVHTAEGVAEVYTRLAAAQERHKYSKNWWTDEQLDYLIAIHTEDFSRTNDELACMCGERFGREVNKNMVTGKLNTLRKAGHIPRYRPGHERKPAAEKETPETATSLPE